MKSKGAQFSSKANTAKISFASTLIIYFSYGLSAARSLLLKSTIGQ